MILSLLLAVVVMRATWRCVEARWSPGIVAGALRVVLMICGLWLAFRTWSIVMMPGLAVRGAPGAISSAGTAVLLAVTQLAGPAVSIAAMVLAYLRYRDVPAKEEDRARRPFNAWLPAGVLDIVYLFIAVVAATFSGDGFGPSE